MGVVSTYIAWIRFVQSLNHLVSFSDDLKHVMSSVIEFDRIKGGKPFDVTLPWFTDLLRDLGQD